MPHRSLSIGAENTFSAHLMLRAGDLASVSVSGTFTGTVTLQRAFDVGSTSLPALTWLDVATYTQAAESSYTAPEDGYVRIGIKSGNYTNGTAVCRIGTARAQFWKTQGAAVVFTGCDAQSSFTINMPRSRMTATVAFRDPTSSLGNGSFTINGVEGP